MVGAAGMLGRDLVRAADAVGLSHAQLDVTDRGTVRQAISAEDLVFNCAAWTDVDGAEQQPGEALHVNRDGARNVAEAAGVVVYLSSDYVFDGRKRQPYLESDPPAPLSAYGHSKLEGERATAAANPRHFVVRSSWLFGHGGRNFVETMLGLGPEVRVVDDQVGRGPRAIGHHRAVRHPPSRSVRLVFVVRARACDLRAHRARGALGALHD